MSLFTKISFEIFTTFSMQMYFFNSLFLLQSLSAKQLDEMKIDMIVMSPPCQPFTRVGKKLDKEDIRTKSFLHLLSLFPRYM